MSYMRTDETKKKQSDKMILLRKSKTSQEILDTSGKMRKSIENRKRMGLGIGRPLSSDPVTKICPACKADIICRTINDIKRKKFCDAKCYHNSKLGIPFIDPDILRNIDRSYQKSPDWASWLKKDTTPEYTRYKNKVHKLSEKNYAKNIDQINPDRNPRTLCGVEGGWQLDHIKPVRECFDAGISVSDAASAENLQMLPWLDNLMRNYP